MTLRADSRRAASSDRSATPTRWLRIGIPVLLVLIWLVGGQPTSSGAYDASIHGVVLGVGVSMIMAHAPIIFPAVLGRPLPYRPVMWLPLGLLNLGLIVRVAGDLAGHTAAYKTGGTLTVLAVLVFAVTMIGVVTAAGRSKAAA